MHHRDRFLIRLCLITFLAIALCGNGAAAETWDPTGKEKAKKLYLLKCAKCHRLYDSKSYDDAQWSEWMVKMKKKAHLDNGQYELILHYLESLRKE
jgi:hypothetical protein